MINRISSFRLLKQLQTPKVLPFSVSCSTSNKTLQQNDPEKWSEIYRLPIIRLVSAFNKLKIYQTFLTLAGTPAAIALEQAGQVDPDFGFAFGTLGLTGVITLSLCSLPFQKLIGFIYVNQGNDKIKLAYVDFWGRRQHQILNIEDILTPWEIPEKRFNLYLPVTNREDASQSYKLIQQFGVIQDVEKYSRIFGND